MNPALKPILAAIESAVVRIEYARDDEHALNEAIQLAADARTLLALLSDGPAFTEADPVPAARRNCLTCHHAFFAPGYGPGNHCSLVTNNPGSFWDSVRAWRGAMTADADNCPGYTLRLTDSAGRNTGST